MNDADSAEIVARFVAGETIKALAMDYGLHRTTIHTHLDKHGVIRSPTPRKLTTRQVTQARKRYEQGDSLATIAKHYGVNARTVATALRAAGEQLRPRRGHSVGGDI